MPTPEEVQARADFAWRQVTRRRTILDSITGEGPMPPAIALDYVQEVLDDRDDCVTALLEAASRWLEELLDWSGDPCECDPDARGLLGDLRGECFQHAEATTQTIWWRCEEVRQRHLFPAGFDFDAAIMWQKWAVVAGVAIGFAREICAAAHPEPA